MISGVSSYSSYNPYSSINSQHHHQEQQTQNVRQDEQQIQAQNIHTSDKIAQENLHLEVKEQNDQTRRSLDILA